ncbi:cation transport ATPase [Elusimicrobium simillimum]|uniref:hypothetical protein n=1 Tax=Elusimicrobium simillimum TaxID=3143438 RepID=UPI003C6FC1DD
MGFIFFILVFISIAVFIVLLQKKVEQIRAGLKKSPQDIEREIKDKGYVEVESVEDRLHNVSMQMRNELPQMRKALLPYFLGLVFIVLCGVVVFFLFPGAGARQYLEAAYFGVALIVVWVILAKIYKALK